MAVSFDIFVDQYGTSPVFCFPVVDGAGVPVDLTGFGGRSEVRDGVGKLVLGLDVYVEDVASGVFRMQVSDEQAAGLADGRYDWDFFVDTPDGESFLMWYGVFRVGKSVTRPIL